MSIEIPNSLLANVETVHSLHTNDTGSLIWGLFAPDSSDRVPVNESDVSGPTSPQLISTARTALFTISADGHLLMGIS